MSRIASISGAGQTGRQASPAPAPHAAGQVMVLPVPSQGRRTASKALAPHSIAFAAQLAAGTPRRGLRAGPADQARIFSLYERTQTPPPLSGRRLRLTA